MAILYRNKLSTRLFTPLIAIFTLVMILLAVYIPNITKQNAINNAISTAEGTVQQY